MVCNNKKKDHGNMTQNPTGIKTMQSNLKICTVMSQPFRVYSELKIGL